MSYRQDYERYYEVAVYNDWDIHHIDYNHNNNDIHNLVALPKYLHKKLHKAYYNFCVWNKNRDLTDIKLISGKVNSDSMFNNSLYEYLTVLQECVPYMNLKDELDMRIKYEQSI